MKRTVLILMTIFAVATANAQSFAEIKAEAEKGDAAAMYELSARYAEVEDYEKALFWTEKAANAGNDRAAFGLSIIYLTGEWGQPKNCDKAIPYLFKAAKISNSPEIQAMVGGLYMADEAEFTKMGCTIIKRDLNEAEKWYRKALENRDIDYNYAYESDRRRAKTGLGNIYFERKNYAEAAKWYSEAAEQEDPNAENQLGWLYENGLGVPKDTKKAAELYRKAAENGNVEAADRLEKLTGERVTPPEYFEPTMLEEETPAKPTEDEGYDLNVKGIEFYNQGNYTEAVKYYHQAAEMGNLSAQNNLAYCYQNGQGVAKNIEEAIKWYREAAEQGYDGAQLQVGYLYESVKQDFNEAAKWYKKSAEQGNATAQGNLGWCYENGKGVAQNYTEAVKWYRKAAEQGDARGQNNVGRCYQNGYGVKQDYTEAIKWYRKAAEQGDEYAKNNIKIVEEHIAAAKSVNASLEGCVFETENGNLTLYFRANFKLDMYDIDHSDPLYGNKDYWYDAAAQKGEFAGLSSFTISGNKLTMTLDAVNRTIVFLLKKGKIPTAAAKSVNASLAGCEFELNMLALKFKVNNEFEFSSLGCSGTYTYNATTQSGELHITNSILGDLGDWTETFKISGNKLTMTNMNKEHILTLTKGKIP
jgi:TPR repeat protein